MSAKQLTDSISDFTLAKLRGIPNAVRNLKVNGSGEWVEGTRHGLDSAAHFVDELLKLYLGKPPTLDEIDPDGRR